MGCTRHSKYYALGLGLGLDLHYVWQHLAILAAAHMSDTSAQQMLQHQHTLQAAVSNSAVRKVLLPAHACDHATRKQWHGGRSKATSKTTQADHFLHHQISSISEQQLLGVSNYCVTTQLTAAVANSGPAGGGLRLLPQLATHNSGPNSGNLRKQPKKEVCHAEGRPALKVTFSGFPRCAHPSLPAPALDSTYSIQSLQTESNCQCTNSGSNQAAAVPLSVIISGRANSGSDCKLVTCDPK
jgi:hypothetical protein